MSWIDQGRQQHGWFGHGTAPFSPSTESPAELRARAFAIVHLAADFPPGQDHVPLPVQRTVEVLRTLAELTAAWSRLPPNAFRQRFFRDGLDPVDAWHIQLFMRGVEDGNDHAALVAAGHRLAGTMEQYGPDGWKGLLGKAVANFRLRGPGNDTAQAVSRDGSKDANVLQARLALAGPVFVPLPPIFIPGSRENEEYWTKPVLKLGRKIGEGIGRLFPNAPPDEQPQSGAPTEGPARDGPDRSLENQGQRPPGTRGLIELPANPDDLLKKRMDRNVSTRGCCRWPSRVRQQGNR